MAGPHFLHQDPDWDPRGQPKGQNGTCLAGGKKPSDFLLDFVKSYQDLAFSIRIQDGVRRDSRRDKNENVWQVEKNPSDFLLDFMRSYQDFTFSIRIQDGVLRDSQRDKNENV